MAYHDADDHRCFPLTREQRHFLEENIFQLSAGINFDQILHLLLDHKCITWFHYEYAREESSSYGEATRLLRILTKRSQVDCETVSKILEENGHEGFAHTLREKGGKAELCSRRHLTELHVLPPTDEEYNRKMAMIEKNKRYMSIIAYALHRRGVCERIEHTGSSYDPDLKSNFRVIMYGGQHLLAVDKDKELSLNVRLEFKDPSSRADADKKLKNIVRLFCQHLEKAVEKLKEQENMINVKFDRRKPPTPIRMDVYNVVHNTLKDNWEEVKFSSTDIIPAFEVDGRRVVLQSLNSKSFYEWRRLSVEEEEKLKNPDRRNK